MDQTPACKSAVYRCSARETVLISSQSEIEDDADRDLRRLGERSAGRRRILDNDESENEDEDEEDDGAIAGPPRHLRGVLGGGSDDEMHLESDEDVDDDGAIRGPSRRLTELMGEEDEDESDDEGFGGRSDNNEQFGGGSDAGEYGGGYGEFEDDY